MIPILEHIYHNLVIHKPEIRQFDLQPSDNFKSIFAITMCPWFPIIERDCL